MMNRAIAFVDGFNLYHSLEENPSYRKYKWLNIRKLLESYVSPKELKEIYYFTALTTWNQSKVNRHKIFIKALEQTGIDVVYGEFRRRDRFCQKCKTSFASFEEKQTDVNIAIYLFRLAIEDRYDTALILSGDSDLLPSIKAVKATFPSKRIVVIIPIGRRAEELKKTCDQFIKIKEKNLAASLFDDPLVMSDGTSLLKPTSWS
ncbi:NYN domain-containing protein [bacterium]|nr:NYN domain-containing protein [bacterium]